MATKKANNETKFSDRKMMLLLYPDDPTHVKAMEIIKQSYDYACILHDRDYFTEEDEVKNPEHVAGTIKKPHWHIVIRLGNNARWNTAVASELGIGLNYIQSIRSMDNALLYLIHYNDGDKAQYDISEVKGNMKAKLKMLVNSDNKTEGEKIVDIIQYIKDYNGYIKVTDFAEYCATNGYWAEFRRSGAIFLKIIEEHNKKFC